MSSVTKIVWMALLIGLLSFALTVTAEVDWTDDVTDPQGDVEDTEGTAFPDRGDADIVSVSITEEDDNINVTMVLAGEYNSSGSYSVSVTVDDGDDGYNFMWSSILTFTVSDPSGLPVTAEGFHSEDGTTLSWVVAKADIDATSELEIEMAMTMIVDFSGVEPSLMDFAGFGVGDMPIPESMDVVLRFAKLNVMEMKMTMTYTGDNANSYRSFLDDDADGTVSDAEYDAFMDDMEWDQPEDPSEANVTLDGKDPTSLGSEYTMEGAKGAVESAQPLKIVVTMSVTFPKPEDKDSHEVVFKEPLFGDDFVGGDEPWENPFDMTFRMQALDGWKFKGGSLPTKMKDYLNDDGDEVEMSGADIQADWNNTFGDLQSFTIEKSDGDSPGFGMLGALVAIGVVVVATRRRD